ncbi:hypothetical protein BDQ12DRAFT_685614 [Crucibulum laeve]|uniref:Uncharacterized protein n=1 Tax=Crucibulum laeve TaxID=68775 RepID=A0A5C3M7Y1_9AGAR|nr:hypothetical protein BDQ12DRAFT_685614 [Crucibulum laeve]
MRASWPSLDFLLPSSPSLSGINLPCGSHFIWSYLLTPIHPRRRDQFTASLTTIQFVLFYSVCAAAPLLTRGSC